MKYLPYTKYPKSKILCPIKNSLITEDNYAVVLPSGYVCSWAVII